MNKGAGRKIIMEGKMTSAEALETSVIDNEKEFIEIRSKSGSETCLVPMFVEAYVGTVEPRCCGALVKQLAHELPLSSSHIHATNPHQQHGSLDLSHLKRVKRIKHEDCGSDRKLPEQKSDVDTLSKVVSKKRPRPYVELQVLLGPVEYVEQNTLIENGADSDTSLERILLLKFNLTSLHKTKVPARLPDSHAEWKEFQQCWPTSYFQDQTSESREKVLQLHQHELKQMEFGVGEALLDAEQAKDLFTTGTSVGTVVIDPQTGVVVARASEEGQLQCGDDVTYCNPLQTSVILAIQGVSRKERTSATQQGMDSAEFQGGQYLCTGYDCYTTREPSAYEAMALVHARIRRLVFGCSSSLAHATTGGLTYHNIHMLPGTNHKFRAFTCQKGSDLWSKCQSLSCAAELQSEVQTVQKTSRVAQLDVTANGLHR